MSETMLTVIYVAVLLIEGFVIKHAPFLKKISNNLIPFILIATGVVVCVVEAQSVSLEVLLKGILSAVLATGIHQTGKISIKSFLTIAVSNLRQNLGGAEVGDVKAVSSTNTTIDEAVDKINQLEEVISGLATSVKELSENKDK